MKFEMKGDLCVASGDNWKYEQVGDLKVFSQTGKVPSLRVIKSAIKLLRGMSIPTNNTRVGDDYINCIYTGGGGFSGATGMPYGYGVAGANGGQGFIGHRVVSIEIDTDKNIITDKQFTDIINP